MPSMNLKNSIPRKEARHKRPHIVWSYLYETSRTRKSIETESKIVVAQGWGWEWGLTACGHKESLWSDENIVTWAAAMVAQLCTFTTDYWTAHLEWVSTLHLNRIIFKNPVMQNKGKPGSMIRWTLDLHILDCPQVLQENTGRVSSVCLVIHKL